MRVISRVFTAIQFAFMAAVFLLGRAGHSYGAGIFFRTRIVCAILRSAFGVGAVTLPNEQLYLINHLLSLPPDFPGDIAEFGCFQGRTSAILSLACRATGRRLAIFDSFEGLPATDHATRELVTGEPVVYTLGEYHGALADVRMMINRRGDLSVCDFIPGYFNHTLPGRQGDRWAMVFEDADLPSSVADVLQYAWPSLLPGGYFFCHEARDPQVVGLFFDQKWWASTLGQEPPQFVGSGTGLPLAFGVRYGGGALSYFGSFLGYAIRR